MLKRILKIGAWLLLLFTTAIVVLIVYVRSVSVIDPPVLTKEIKRPLVVEVDSGLFVTGNNWFRKSESGLYELFVEGEPLERGMAIGALSEELVQYQEKVFNDQIRQIVPSKTYLNFLKYFVGWFNRDLNKHVPLEFQQEIFGVSQFASSEYDDIAPAYQRILNYHAAHDLGHALQNMSLVGCSSFATWNENSEDGRLIVARNFDFYVGDEFARNKIVAFYKPSRGYNFMMVTFGGMIGVLSGMNSEGLTVTINAAKAEIPSSAATPVSIVAREILQYASNIEEAYAIAAKRKMFVAESFLIGSAKEKRAAIIEKSNDVIGIYHPEEPRVVCTNHFQSETLKGFETNQEHLRTSASAYRHERIVELLSSTPENTPANSVKILRDRNGLNGASLGLGNEKSVNQLIAHHAIIFDPERQLVWVSTAPWQLGKFVCYDLNLVFGQKRTTNEEIYRKDLEINEDPFIQTAEYTDFLKASKYRLPFSRKDDLQPDSLIKWNPQSYHSFMLAGDFCFDRSDYAQAKKFYEIALTLEIATEGERSHILENLDQCNNELK